MSLSLESRLRALGPDLDRLERLTVITGVLVNEAPLRIGTGRGELGGPTELPVEKLPDGTPYIPGSSLKGALRSLAEKLARGSNRKVCNIFADLTPCELAAAVARKALDAIRLSSPEFFRRELADILSRAGVIGGELKELADEIGSIVSAVRGPEDLEDAIGKLINVLNGLPCPVCRIFGNKELASHVRIMNAYPKAGQQKPEPQFRTRVALDRFRRAARSGALFDYEFVPPGYKWDFEMRVLNLDLLKPCDDVSKLLRHVLDYVAEFGLEVGGMKSVGHGLMKFEGLRAKVYCVEDFRIKLVEEVSLLEGH